jgi:exonuclease SbcC
MILHAIELTYVGRFRETVRLGPFAAGLNILSAPNESGKSTSIRAAARALFDRHTTKSDELKSLQPAGTDLAPRIAVEFETAAGRYRIEKTFLQSPRSLLKQWQSGAWQPLAEADLADQRVQALLHSSLPGKGATKPEHWGFLGFLWARQGEPAEWPGLDDEAVGQRIRARLARVELDPVIEQLRARLATTAESLLTSGGKPKVGGPLATVEADLAALDASLATLRQTRADLDSAHQRHQQADADVARLEKEHAERSTATTALRDQANAAERLRNELDVRQQALAHAQEKLTALATDADALALRRAELTAAQATLVTDESSAVAAVKAHADLRARLDAMQDERPRRETALAALRDRHQRLQSLIKLRQLTATVTAFEKQLAASTTLAAEIANLEAKKAKLPGLTSAKLRKLEDLADSIRTLRTQVQALGLSVELTPEHKTSLEVHGESAPRRENLHAGKTARLQRPQFLDLHLTGWGRVVIRSGAQDAQTAAADLAKTEAALREALADAEIASVEAARDAVAARKDLEAQLKTAHAALTPHLGDHDSLESLREAAATATRRAEARSATLAPTSEEQSLGLTDLETAEAAEVEALPAAEKIFRAFDKQLAAFATDERTSAQYVTAAEKTVGTHRATLRTLETQIADLTGRYPDGLDAAKKAAQLAFAQAEARVIATKTELPPDFEKLPERAKRAATGLQQIANELAARRSERDEAKGKLETLGGQGLYSRETVFEERRAEALLRRDAARAKAWCARLAQDLIEHRKQAATKAVLTPLEHRLTSAFAELTGDTTREVFLDEHLQIAGIGLTREAAHAFDQLSQGAKEQLLLCLRLAVAQELSTDEPQVLILDDVLVNTDPVRQERILDVLGTQASRLQILILTCHPDRYRGVGQPITLTAGSEK